MSQDASYTLHIHHALFAGLLASWFWDFDTLFDVVLNAFFMGIVVEGIDFYGISELHLFIIRYGASVSMLGIFITWVISLLIAFTLACKKEKPKTELEIPLIYI